MNKLKSIIENLPWWGVIFLCLTLGLAPFTPPHIWEKLNMLARGTLVAPIDWFDLFMHGTPWLLLFLKVLFFFSNPKTQQ